MEEQNWIELNKKAIELRKGIKEDSWPTKLNDMQKEILSSLLLKFSQRFRYGVAGHNYPYVEVEVRDHLVEGILKILPLGKRKRKYKHQESKQNCFFLPLNVEIILFSPAKAELSKNYQYYEQEMKKYTTVKLNREEAREFVSIFENIDASLEQMWIHLKHQPGIFRKIDPTVVETMFYDKDKQVRFETRDDMVSKYLDQKYQGKPYMTKRVSVVFGDENRVYPLYLRLVHVENAIGFGRGMLRLHFSYKTIDSGKVTHMMPWQNKKRKRDEKEEEEEERYVEIEGKKCYISKEDDPEKVKRDMALFKKKKEVYDTVFEKNGSYKPYYHKFIVEAINNNRKIPKIYVNEFAEIVFED